MKTGKRPRRLTKLVINEVSSVDAAANPGSQVVLLKRYAEPSGHTWGPAFNLVRKEKPVPGEPVSDADRLAAAKREIQENLAVGKAALPGTEDHNMTDDIIGAMSDRVAEIAKAAGCTTEAAMMRLAESRSLEDQALWREYKLGTAPASTVVDKQYDPDKAGRRMAKRADELVAAGAAPSRQAAIAKVAESRDPDDQKLWARYRQSGAVLDNSGPEPVGKMESPFAVLVRTIISSYGVSREVAERWAKLVQAKTPPAAMLGGRQTIA